MLLTEANFWLTYGQAQQVAVKFLVRAKILSRIAEAPKNKSLIKLICDATEIEMPLVNKKDMCAWIQSWAKGWVLSKFRTLGEYKKAMNEPIELTFGHKTKNYVHILKDVKKSRKIPVVTASTIAYQYEETYPSREILLGGGFYKLKIWKIVRYEVLKENNGKCCLCGSGRKQGIILTVDHIKPRNLYPELALDKRNLQVLCNDCNEGKGKMDETDWR